MTRCRCPRLHRINYWINTTTWYNSMMEKKGMWTRSRSVSCVSMVYNNTAQAALYTVGPFGKHKWSPIPDQTDPPGGNHICSILSEGGVKRKLQKNHKKGTWDTWDTEERIWYKFLPDISGWFPALCLMFAVLLTVLAVCHTLQTVTVPRGSSQITSVSPYYFFWLHWEVLYKHSYFPHDEH